MKSCIKFDRKLCTIDTVGASLYQDYPEEAEPLFLRLEPEVALACGLEPTQLYRVRKSLYGLPDAGRAYYHAYSTHLKNHGYLQTSLILVSLSRRELATGHTYGYT
jgi:hypothetical protein